MKIRLTWDEYKDFASKAIKEKYPNIQNNDSVRFLKVVSYEGECDLYEYPEIVEFNIED